MEIVAEQPRPPDDPVVTKWTKVTSGRKSPSYGDLFERATDIMSRCHGEDVRRPNVYFFRKYATLQTPIPKTDSVTESPR